MVQTINIKSDGLFEVNFGNQEIVGSADDISIPATFLEKIASIQNTINSLGLSELHAEKDTFRSFVHTRKGSELEAHDFGTYVTAEEFSSIMAEENNVISAPQEPQEETVTP